MFLEMQRKGMTLDEIAEATGLSRYQVHRRITKERWESGEVVISDQKLRKMIDEGLTVRQMAERHFCSVGCIAKKLKRAGLSTGPPGNPNFLRREHS